MDPQLIQMLMQNPELMAQLRAMLMGGMPPGGPGGGMPPGGMPPGM